MERITLGNNNAVKEILPVYTGQQTHFKLRMIFHEKQVSGKTV